MARTLVVLDHPYTYASSENELHNRSFSAALCKSVVEKLEGRGEEVDLIDLHADGFNPVMSAEDLRSWRKGEPMGADVERYQQRWLAADRVVFVFPVWWELMPAMTKGFIDKVYAKNMMYDQGEGADFKTRLKPGFEMVFLTPMGTPTPVYKFIIGNPIVKAIGRGMCTKTGIKKFRWIPYSNVDKLSEEQRAKLLSEVDV